MTAIPRDVMSGVMLHEACKIFPELTGDDYEKLKADIRANGLREPIVMYQGAVLDGRNRLRACKELGIAPRFTEWKPGKGDSPAALVTSLNLARRHLTPSQRNAIGADLEEVFAAEAKERQRKAGKVNGRGQINGKLSGQGQKPIHAATEAAKLVGGKEREIFKAKAIKKASPELHAEVKAGGKTISEAMSEVRKLAKTKELDAKAKAAEAAAKQSPRTWRIIQGECTAVEIPEAPARLIFADPPYNIGVEYGDHYDDARPFEDYEAWSVEWLSMCRRRLTWDGTLFLLINWEWAHPLAVQAVELGFHLRQTIVWFESFGVNCGRKYNRCSRALLWFTRHRETFVFHDTRPEIRRKSDRQEIYNDARANEDGKLWDDVWGINPPIPRIPGTAKERLPDFPTQLPLKLLRPIVAAHSDPGDLVIDPFSGSGTTGCACIELGRRFVGVELSREYAELSRKRLLTHRKED